MEMNHRWRWLSAEFTIIVLGVLSALFVDTWIQERSDAARAAEYRARLAADLRTDVNEINARMDYFQRVRDFGLAVLEVYEGRGQMNDFEFMFSSFNAAEE